MTETVPRSLSPEAPTFDHLHRSVYRCLECSSGVEMTYAQHLAHRRDYPRHVMEYRYSYSEKIPAKHPWTRGQP